MIDPSIPLAIKPPQFADPLEQQGKVMNLLAMRQQIQMAPLHQQALQQQIQAGTLENQQRQTAIDEEKGFKEALGRNASPFELLSTAPKLAVPHLKAIAEQQKLQLESYKQKTTLLANSLGSVKYAPPEMQAQRYAQVRQEAIANGLAKPADVPEQYDPAFVDQHFRAAIDADKQIDDHAKELDYAQHVIEAAPKTAKEWTDLILKEGSAARSQNELDQTRASLQGLGVPKALLAQTLPAMWSEAAMQQLGDRSMTPEQRRQVGIQKQNADTAAKNAENNVSEYELELRAAKGDPVAKQALASSAERKKQIAAAGGAAVRGLDHEISQYGKPFDEVVKGADAQLEKILDAEKMIAGGAVSQALGVPKILTALVSGQGSGVRITQAELNSIAKARGIGGDIEGFINKLSGNGALTQSQKDQMQAMLQDVRQRIVERKMIARGASDEMLAATSRDGVITAARKGRESMDAHVGNSSGTTHFQDGGVSYDIPADKVRAFLSSHPNATKGQ